MQIPFHIVITANVITLTRLLVCFSNIAMSKLYVDRNKNDKYYRLKLHSHCPNLLVDLFSKRYSLDFKNSREVPILRKI